MGKYLAGFLASVSTLAITSFAAQAGALPSHGHFVSGQGSIAKGNQSLTVKQSSTTGIINWNSFSVGQKSGVTFDNGHGATLNRVTGDNLSTIAGSLHATGSLYLMNSSGVIVSGAGHIVTGGSFVATSGNIANAAFDGTDRRFKAGSGSIVNEGTITSGGSASLIGSNVGDSGSIRASSVELSATHKLGISGDIAAQTGDGTGGTVTARGRTIVIGADGDIDASAAATGQKGGTISVVARGTTTVAGTLKAEGGSNGTGGFIDTSGEHVQVADSANISTLASNGKTGTWLIDPKDFTIAASGGDITGATLSSQLNTTSVLIQSIAGAKSGNGDIFVDDAVAWSASNALTLDAYRNIVFNAAVKLTGAGGLVLIDADRTQALHTPGANDGNAADGDLIFNSGGSVAFTDAVADATQGSLTINGTSYTLENNIASLASAISSNAFGDFALANNYNAAGDNSGAGYTGAVIGTTFLGTFEGLGHTISNLSIAATADNSDVGLFGQVGATTGAHPGSGTIRDITLTNAVVSDSGQFSDVGAVAGALVAGTIENAHSSGTVTGSNEGADAGGLVGLSAATITDSSSSAAVTGASEGAAGGFAGFVAGGTLANDFATGTVSGGATYAGGFVGAVSMNTGAISVTDSYATGNVTGSATYMGGFAGVFGGNGGTYNATNDYATGSVSGGATFGGGFAGILGGNGGTYTVTDVYATGNAYGSSDAGGLAGSIGGNGGSVIITDAYATGNASSGGEAGGFAGSIGGGGTENISGSFATGNTTGGYDAGGFVGYNNGTISDSYSLGNAASTQEGGDSGGFVGYADSSSVVQNAFSLGSSTAASFSQVGGFVGSESSSASQTHDYWNTQTSGTTSASSSATTGITGLTTAGLMSKLPTGFSKTNWATGTGLLPYLKWQFTSAPDAVSGIELSGLGGTGVSGATISLMQSGEVLNSVSGASATTYANGYYYFLLAPGTISTTAHAGLIAYDATNKAVAFADEADGSISGLDLTESFLNETTSETTLTDVTANLQKALKGSSVVAKLVKKATNRAIASTGSFAINKALTLTGGTLVISAAKGTVTEADAIKASNLLLEGAADFDLATEANSIATLAKKGAGDLSLKDAHALTIGSVGGVNGVAASANVSLTTTTGGITIEQLLAASDKTVSLNAAKGIFESGAGALTAATLNGMSKGGVTLDGANAIGDLDGFTTAGGDFSLTDNHKLIVTGEVNAGAGTLSLTTTGTTKHDLDIDSIVKGATVKLVTAGEASETAAGSIIANKLNVTAATGIVLTSKSNQIKKLGTDQTTKGPNKVTL